MSRYIDADKLLEYAEKRKLQGVPVDVIKSKETADVEEVRHGEWIPLGCSDDDWNLLRFKCSICGREIHEHKNYDQLLKIKYPYCHCGARMNGGEEE